MAVGDWVYDEDARRFRDARTGKFLSRQTVLDLRDALADGTGRTVETLTRALADESISLAQWERGMRRLITSAYLGQYALGRGGLKAMRADDDAEVARVVEGQFAFLRQFALAIADWTMTEAQIVARGQIYLAGSVETFERGRAAGWGVALPAYPGDGGTPCLGNCRCRWELERDGEQTRATWVLHAAGAEACPGCVDRAREYRSIVV